MQALKKLPLLIGFGAALFLTIPLPAFVALAAPPPSFSTNDLLLSRCWRIQSSALGGDDGAEISAPDFDASSWHPAAVPSTVLAALVDEGVYSNIFFGTNLEKIPTAPFTNAWWFRGEFSLSTAQAGENADLIFDGINYRANIWLNGRRIAEADHAFGAFRIFHFDVGGLLQAGRNALAVEIFPPRPGDYTMGFVDWNPKPADHEMGLFRPVKLHFSRGVSLENVFVQTSINHTNWESADLIVCADLTNHADTPVNIQLEARFEGRSSAEQFSLAAHEGRTVRLTAQRDPALHLDHARLWWPWELGQPNLYSLRLTAEADGRVFDSQNVRFGVREVADYLTPEGYRGYKVNGKKILIRGGGWADEFLLRESQTNLEAQLQYVKAMNLNAIRLEGVWGSSQRLYDLADEYGLLIMPGWSCQWEWEDVLGRKTDDYGAFQSDAEMTLATNYLHDQVLWLRQHPSIFVWVLGSDKHPRPGLETRYDAILPTIDPTRPTLMSCAGIKSSISGPSGVKMNGPYDYVTPNYWYLDTHNGGAFGFNTETGPGPQPPPLDSLRRMFPAADLWPIDEVWNFHCARGRFHDMTRYLEAFDARYGRPSGVADFAFKSQAANYEAIRAMFEAFSLNVPRATGIVQWMLNASWPKLFWQLYDYYLVPGGAFFGVKHGAAPFNVIYNYGDHAVWVVNRTDKDLGPCRVTVAGYGLDAKRILDKTITVSAAARRSTKIMDTSALASAWPVYFLDLRASARGAAADNFYWLSSQPDVLDEAKTEWFVTPDKSYADFTALNRLPSVPVRSRVKFSLSRPPAAGSPVTRSAEVTLTNPTDNLAFFIEMRIVGASSRHLLTPVFWDDNYVSLPPHATRVFHAHFPANETPQLELQGWNATFPSMAGESANVP